jgi:acyl-ACP thioesterase
MREIYEKSIKVASYECDLKNRMKMSAILSQNQQIGIDHCNKLKFTEELKNTNTALFVAQIAIDLNQTILAEETLKIKTEPFLPSRAVYHRLTDFFSAKSDEPLVHIDASWILVDIETKKILREPPKNMNLPGFTDISDLKNENLKPQKSRIKKGDNCVFVGEEQINYSRCDANGHLNNAEYAAIVCDYLPSEVLLNRFPQKMIIIYHKEVLFREKISLFISEFSRNEYYFCAFNEKNKCFEANVIF